MSEAEALLEAEILLDSYGESSPLLHLALLSAPACRVEPQLLRRLRLVCVPEADVSVEQELWFSELVNSRGRTITYRESVVTVMRRRLRELLLQQPQRVRQARQIMMQVHAHLPPLLIMEDRLAWAEVFEEREDIQTGAQNLLRSLLMGRDGLDHWLGRVWHGLPGQLKQLPEGKQLAQVAAARGASIDEMDDAPQVQDVAHVLPPVPLLLRRDEIRLGINVPPQEATHVIEIPDTRPLAVALDSGSGFQEVVFAVGESRDLEVGSGMVTLRTLAGDEYELEAVIGAETAAGSEGLEVELLPAGDGTSLLIQAGDPSSPVRILVDCGRRGAGRLLEERLGQLEPDSSYLDLMVLTHIDDDRIGGALALLENDKLELEIRDIWFNGYRHLAAPQEREL